MQGRLISWSLLRVSQVAYTTLVLAAAPVLALFVLKYGKRGLLFSILYGVVFAWLHKRLASWECPRCGHPFLGGHVEWKRLVRKTCCANCGLRQASETAYP